jgi:hypothetical protein
MSETEIADGVHVIHSPAGDLRPEEYADRHKKALRTVRRWLADSELPGAWQDPQSKKWNIPADVERVVSDVPKVERPRPVEYVMQPPAGLVPGAGLVLHDQHRQLEAPREPTRLEDLAEEAAFLTVADAAAYLGIPQAQILAQPEVFDVMHVGVNGSPRVPKATIKKFEGS